MIGQFTFWKRNSNIIQMGFIFLWEVVWFSRFFFFHLFKACIMLVSTPFYILFNHEKNSKFTTWLVKDLVWTFLILEKHNLYFLFEFQGVVLILCLSISRLIIWMIIRKLFYAFKESSWKPVQFLFPLKMSEGICFNMNLFNFRLWTISYFWGQLDGEKSTNWDHVNIYFYKGGCVLFYGKILKDNF